jgi:hypothetical protein
VRKRIVLCDSDQDYAVRVSNYVHEQRWRRELQLTVCTSIESLMDLLKHSNPELIVIHESFRFREELEQIVQPKVWLTEEKILSRYLQSNACSKYEYMPHLIRTWLNNCDPTNKQTYESTIASVITIWSPHGGVGKTTLALKLAEFWANNKERTFLISSEAVENSMNFEKQSIIHNVSEWLYAWKCGNQVQPSIIDMHNDNPYLHCLSSKISLREFVAMKNNDADEILQHARNAFGCKYVIMDAGSGCSEFAEAALLHCDIVVFMVIDDSVRMSHLNRWMNDFPEWNMNGELHQKSLFVCNKSLQPSMKHGLYSLGTPLHLPYVPEWKNNRNFYDPLYSHHLKFVAEALMNRCS